MAQRKERRRVSYVGQQFRLLYDMSYTTKQGKKENMKTTRMTIRLEPQDEARLDESRGKQTRSDYIRSLVRKSAGTAQDEVAQFVDILKRIEAVTKVVDTVERIDQQLS